MTYYDDLKTKPIRLIELFGGIGSQAKALKNLGVDFEHWRVCEFDKHAINSYNAVHGTNFATSDITKLHGEDLGITDRATYTYLLTYSFPCQDLSNAGLGRGMEKGSGTRSGLLWEVERLLNESPKLPQVLLMENVPQVHGVKNIKHFEKWMEFLESKGYSNFWKDLNAKDYGIPQSRNRCFMVSILGADDIFTFPEPMPLALKLGDMLETEVDEKYYLSDKAIQGDVIRHSYTRNRLDNGIENMGRTESKEKLSPTLDTRCDCLGVVVKEPTDLQKEVCNQAIENGLMRPHDIIDYTYSKARLDEIKNGKIKTINSADNQIANTLTTNAEHFGVCVHPLRIRKLTPKECWRLMGFDDEDFHKAEKVCSNSQLYKQAGNSIVVNVLMAIFKELFVPKKTRSEWLDELLS